MRRFQYKTLNAFTDDELNALGADGWELVAVVERRAYLKREIDLEAEWEEEHEIWRKMKAKQAEYDMDSRPLTATVIDGKAYINSNPLAE